MHYTVVSAMWAMSDGGRATHDGFIAKPSRPLPFATNKEGRASLRVLHHRLSVATQAGWLHKHADGWWVDVPKTAQVRAHGTAPTYGYGKPFPAHVRRAVYLRDGMHCQTCGATSLLTLDHVLPRSLGGSDETWNLQVLCSSCNSRKGERIR